MKYTICIKERTCTQIMSSESNKKFVKIIEFKKDGTVEVSVNVTPKNFKSVIDIFFDAGYQISNRERLIAC